MKTSKPTPERNLGARDERRDLVVHIKTLPRQLDRDELLAWIRGRAKRTARIAGGVGRK